MASYKEKYERARRRARDAYESKKDAARATITAGEIVLGAGLSGYVAETYPTVAGVPTDAGLGIGLLAGGMALGQGDLTALGLGMLAGYAREFGSQMAITQNGSNGTAQIGDSASASERAAAADKQTLSWAQGGGAGVYVG